VNLKVRTTGNEDLNDTLLKNHISKKNALDRSSLPEVSKVSSEVELTESDLEGGNPTDGKGGKSNNLIAPVDGPTNAEASESDMPMDEPAANRTIPMPAVKDRANIKNFASNYISTTKYSALTFLPKGLFYQFMQLSNCYFLLMTIL
jgi:hypothetical protein